MAREGVADHHHLLMAKELLMAGVQLVHTNHLIVTNHAAPTRKAAARLGQFLDRFRLIQRQVAVLVVVAAVHRRDHEMRESLAAEGGLEARER